MVIPNQKTPDSARPVWKFGSVENSNPVSHLMKVSRASAAFSLSRFAQDGDFELLNTAVATGLALESLLKAVAAKASPFLLLANMSNLDHSFFIGGIEAGLMGDVQTTDLFTIGADRAWDIASKLKAISDKPAIADKKLVLQTRNAAAHMGLVDSETVQESQKAFIRLADKFLPALGMTRATYFGARTLDLVSVVLSDQSNAIEQSLVSKKITASKIWHAFRDGTAPDKREGIIRTMEFVMNPRDDDPSVVETAKCVVCRRVGRMDFDFDYTLDPRFLDADYNDIYHSERVIRGFSCPVCQLQLNAAETDLAFFSTQTREAGKGRA